MCHAPNTFVGHAAAPPRMLFLERGARFPAVYCLGRANVALSLCPWLPLALQAFAGIFLSLPRWVFGDRKCWEFVNHPNKDITLIPCAIPIDYLTGGMKWKNGSICIIPH